MPSLTTHDLALTGHAPPGQGKRPAADVGTATVIAWAGTHRLAELLLASLATTPTSARDHLVDGTMSAIISGLSAPVPPAVVAPDTGCTMGTASRAGRWGPPPTRSGLRLPNEVEQLTDAGPCAEPDQEQPGGQAQGCGRMRGEHGFDRGLDGLALKLPGSSA